MSAYIPLIKNTKWIDLSPDHRDLRGELELDTFNAVVKKAQVQPIMLQGAFGIGKTNSLYYIFHYGWSKLNTPTFFVSLDEITKLIKTAAVQTETGRLQNDQLASLINNSLENQINALKEQDWSNLQNIYFPEFNGGDLDAYLKEFQAVEVIDEAKVHSRFDKQFSKPVITEAVNSGNRPILLIDEFESKFYELKKYIETSGGGVLRELFDQIVQDTNLFFLIIGNGPASGYEIAKERGDEAADSETAANRRLKTKSIPFPTSNLLQRSFLKDEPKGYTNFIWWLSRCRPGHILKLRDSLGPADGLKALNTNEIITKPIFKEPIDEGGEAVSYLKTQFFNQINGRVQAAILGKVLIEFQPIEFGIKDFKHDLRECVQFFLCSSETINTEIDLIPVLREDLYLGYLVKNQDQGKFDAVNYIEHIQPYFSYILSALSDSEGRIAFGMINDSNPNDVLASTFLIPLFELTYDFISLYQDDSIRETRQSLDFLLDIINQVNNHKEEDKLEIFVPNTFERFEKCRLLRHNDLYLQLSLFAIRESIEQPIGSPILKYKNDAVSTVISKLKPKEGIPIIFHKEENVLNYLIPDLADEVLTKYLQNLQAHLFGHFYDKFRTEGSVVVRVIYFEKNASIDAFRTELLYKDGDTNKPEPIYTLGKIDVVDIESYQLNFAGQIRDFIDSVSKIAVIAHSRNEGEFNKSTIDEGLLNLHDIIKVIGDRPWTEKKETIRTIEHYRKLIFDGTNSAMRSIFDIANAEYKAQLAQNVTSDEEFKKSIFEYHYIKNIIWDETEAYDKFTICLALQFLIENNSFDDTLKQLLELCKTDYRFDTNKEDPTIGIDFRSLLSILSKNKTSLEKHFSEFDLNSAFITKLMAFTEKLLNEDSLTEIDQFYSFLKHNSDSCFIRSYHTALGGYLLPELTESLYYLSHLRSLDKQVTIESLQEWIGSIETKLSSIRAAIATQIDEIRLILDKDESFSSYAEKLGRAVKGIALIKSILDKDPSRSTLLILNSVCHHLNRIVHSASIFKDQLDQIYKLICVQKLKVDAFQEKVDEFYANPLTEKILSITYPKKRNEDYLWKKNYLGDNLKGREELASLLGESKNFYNPFSAPTIYPEKLKVFQKCLTAITEKLTPTYVELVANMKEVQRTTETIASLKEFINQLLLPVKQ